MSIWNKVLVGLIFVASLAFFYMAMRTLKTHQYWRQNARGHRKRLDEFQEKNRQLVKGSGEGEDYQPGIEGLRLELRKILADRGRAAGECPCAEMSNSRSYADDEGQGWRRINASQRPGH